MAGNLWKPEGDNTGNLVVLFEQKPGKVEIIDASTGEVLEVGRSTGPSNGRVDTIRFSKPGSAYRNIIIRTQNSGSISIGDGGRRYDDFSLGGGDAGSGSIPSAGGGVPGVADPLLLDPNDVETFPISSTPVDFTEIEAAPFEFTDPLESAGRTGQFNRGQQALNFTQGLNQGIILQKMDLLAIQDFAKNISGTQRELLGAENAFNRGERLKAAEAAVPGIQDTFSRQRDRAETFASGRLLSSAEDRALELAAASASAEGSFVRGFGDDSVVGRRQSDMLSAEQRLGISQLGEGLLSKSIAEATGILMDQPLKANISQRLPAQPPVNVSQLATSQAAQLDRLTTIDPAVALGSEVTQQQFGTNIEQRTREFNATGDIQEQQFNSNKDYAVAEFNSRQSFEGMLTRLNIMASNNAAIQAADQAGLDATAAGEQIEIEQDIRNEMEDRMDTLLAIYRRNRDREALIQGVTTALSVAAIYLASDDVRGIVDNIIDGVVSNGSDIVDLITGGNFSNLGRPGGLSTTGPGDASTTPGSTQEPVQESERTPEQVPDFGDNAVVTPPDEIPPGNVGISTHVDGGTISVPASDYYNVYGLDLTTATGRFKAYANPPSRTHDTFDSGAVLSISPQFRIELGNMV